MVHYYLNEIRLSDISNLCRDKILVGWDIVNFMYIDMTIYGCYSTMYVPYEPFDNL